MRLVMETESEMSDLSKALLAEIDLPGRLELSTASDTFGDSTVVRVTQQFASGRKYVAMTSVPNDVIAALPPAELGLFLGRGLYDQMRPWLRPDRPAWPAFDPFPRATTAWRRWRNGWREVGSAWRHLVATWRVESRKWRQQ